MKKFTALFLALGTSLVILGALFKIMHWGHSFVLIGVGLLAEVLALISFLIHRLKIWHEYPFKKIALLSLVFGGFLVVVGALFKIMHLPASSIIMLFGIGVEVAALVAFFSSGKPKHMA